MSEAVPEMVERTARAIAAAEHFDDSMWFDYVSAARTVLDALREPTKQMVEAAWPDIMHENASDVWRTMINAALGTHDKGEGR